MAQLRIIVPGGDDVLTYAPEKPAELKGARDKLDELLGTGYTAIAVQPGESVGRRITTLDPLAERIVVIPQFRGG